MGLFWAGIFCLAAFGTLCFFLSRQLVGRLLSIFRGVAVQGECVKVYSSEGSEGNTYWHHVYGFTTLEGQYIEFEEDAMFMAQGQEVTVRYRPVAKAERVARTATVMGRGGAWSPLFGQLFGVAISGIFVLFGMLFVVLAVEEWLK
jgi:hypothetical protein